MGRQADGGRMRTNTYLPAHLTDGQPSIPDGTYMTDPTGDFLMRPTEERTQRRITTWRNVDAAQFSTEVGPGGRVHTSTVLGRRIARGVAR